MRWTDRRCLGVATATLSLVLTMLFVAQAPSGATEQGGKDAPLDPSMTQVAVDLQRTETHLSQSSAKLADAQIGEESTLASLNVTLGELSVNDAELTQVTDRLRQRSVLAYQRFGSAPAAVLNIDRVEDLQVARHYSDAAVQIDTSELSQLKQVQDKLEQERAQKVAAHDDAEAQRGALAQLVGQLTARQKVDGDRLSAAGAVPIMGESQLDAHQIASWYHSTGAAPRLAAGTTIDDVARLYLEEGAAEGVRGDLAFAQAIVETASFAVAAGNNFSGIGVCDSCTGGYAFPTPRDGIRAQIQLLKNYADPDSRAGSLANPPSPALYGGDREKAAHTFDTFFLKGKAPLWNLMGHGNWATDPTYAPKVVGVFNQMVAYANAHPEAP